MQKVMMYLAGRYIEWMTYFFPSYGGKIGFRMFCYPMRGKWQPYYQAFLDTAQQSVLKHKGTKVQVYQWGHGPKKVLLLHGWQSHSFRWKNYIPAFPAEEYTCYALDAPGHGLSGGSFLSVPLYSEVVEKFLQHVGPLEAAIGHSVGGFTMLYTHYRLPHLAIKKLVVLAAPGQASEFISFFQQSLHLSDRTIRAIDKTFTKTIGQPIAHFSAPLFVPQLEKPGLIIHDEEDGDTSYTHALALHEAWPSSCLHITKGLGHNLKSTDVIEEVFAFVATSQDVVKADL